ncbi:MAG: hypothetical protein KTR14_08430 [Vampirovibrio sp.]|nr:hypothetical protein [Vampirovibrio sp.]
MGIQAPPANAYPMQSPPAQPGGVQPRGAVQYPNGVDLFVPKTGAGPIWVAPSTPKPAISPLLPGINQAGPATLAQSVPVQPISHHSNHNLLPVVDVPPPWMVAPNLFNSRHAKAQAPGMIPAIQQNYMYNTAYPGTYSGAYPGAYPGMQPQSPFAIPGASPIPRLLPGLTQQGNQQSQQPQQSIQPGNQQPNPQSTTGAKPPPTKSPSATTPTPSQHPPTTPVGGVGYTLTDPMVRLLTVQLNDPSPMIRGAAVDDFTKIIHHNPTIWNDPRYKPYIDAFALKILQDPSPAVRFPLLAKMELMFRDAPHTEFVPSLSPKVVDRLTTLSQRRSDIIDFDGPVAGYILDAMKYTPTTQVAAASNSTGLLQQTIQPQQPGNSLNVVSPAPALPEASFPSNLGGLPNVVQA